MRVTTLGQVDVNTDTVATLNALALNGSTTILDDFGCEWSWDQDPQPWSPAPAPREVTGDRLGPGSWDATTEYGPRTYALSGTCEAPDHRALHAAKSRLSAAVGVRPFDFRVIEPGFDRSSTGRRTGEVLWTEIGDANLSRAKWSASLWFPDPYIYSTAWHSASTALPSTSGGWTFPFTFPWVWNAVAASGQLAMHNDGGEVAKPRITLYGPLATPRLTDASGAELRINATLAAGEFVVIDAATHQVLLMGQDSAPRRSWFVGTWLALAPGDNTWMFAADSGLPGTQQAFVEWRDTWI